MKDRLTAWLEKHGGHPYTKANIEMCQKLSLPCPDEECWMLLDAFEQEKINSEDLLEGLSVVSGLTLKEVLVRLG